MEERVNVAEILRNCQAGMILDCVCFENVVFDRVDYKNRIRCFVGSQRDEVSFNEYGCLNGSPSAKCVIFPKGKTTWNNLSDKYNYKDGDILYCKSLYEWVFIYKNTRDYGIHRYVALCCNNNTFYTKPGRPLLDSSDFKGSRFATQSEKQKLFDAIRANGYRWDSETKTLEKLPKFKVGDWVIHHSQEGMIYQVEKSFLDVTYRIVPVNDKIGKAITTATEDAIHLWTIQDAKDGDVLVHNSIPFIFMGIKNGTVKGICTELGDTILNFGNPEYANDYCPATQEQRDLLFQKMKESGYEWNAEKKELKKIEPKSTLSEEDEKILEIIASVLRVNFEPTEKFFGCEEYMNVDLINWLKSLKDRYTWKPSDDEMG